MTWGKLCDTMWMHPKIVACGNEAVGAWARMISYSCGQLTDGFIPAAIVATITKPSVIRRLVAERLLDEVPGGVSVHDFAIYNPSRSKVEANRAQTAARVAEHRENKAKTSVRNAVTDRVTNAVTNAVSNDPVTGAPTRPDPTRPAEEDISSPAAVAPSALPAQATVPPVLALDPEPVPAKKPRTSKPPKPPPPFGIADAFAALAEGAGSRFAAGVEGDWTKGVRIAVAGLVRQYPDLGAWRTVGEWLAAGAERHRGTIGPSWAASAALPDAMARSRDWVASGRGPVVGARAQVVDAVPDVWGAKLAQGVVL